MKSQYPHAFLLCRVLICLWVAWPLCSCSSMYDASMAGWVLKGAANNDVRTVQRNIRPDNARIRDGQRGEEPIYFAAAHGNRSMINLLHNNGASFHYRTREGKSLAYVAAAHGHAQVARRFVQLGGGSSSDLNEGAKAHARQAAYNKQMMSAALGFAALLISGGGNEEEGMSKCIVCGEDNYGFDSVCNRCKRLQSGSW